ncbi:hypothetical protein Fleli_1578 [Bernardetia litoralis DSM 6794]|uniref:Secretion system C-terminal sorting domain-containing protein n=1 Tax=Bernardetia litoralis (strain ATCC 23117 / DSM 6794 / NBRC 15988 / NCIMB 1366 / Fx l1 / Sio-4) TaxID=880071 RepID=I4AJ62_BERLS|nr:T9SS type A sorting domain-containing protein [Bernardetia litoralis]AFM03997.1 hypothetical protein Fleli_1578 [Bernardetia litoralis DSM 6794]
MQTQKAGNSIGTTMPARFVPQQNFYNLANTVRKAVLSLFFLFIVCASYAQNVTIVDNPAAYYCGQVITLEAGDSQTNDYYWTATGGISLRQVGTTGSGQGTVGIIGNNKVEAIINGSGTVSYSCATGCSSTGSISLSPSPSNLNSLRYSSSTAINQPNGIQTTKGWICVSNDGSTQTITVSNSSPLNIFWVVSGGAVKVSETQAVVASDYTYTVTVATSGPTAGKGSIRAFVSDPCGTLTCDPALDWEILKDLMPSEIAGPTCLRDNNLDASGTVVYSIPDAFAGNAVYNWELLQDGVPVTRDDFKIRSQVLYGNSATIEYNGVVPSDIGNFSLRISNSCSSTVFIRDVTVSPATPNITSANNTYCVPATSPTTTTISLPAILPGQSYSAVAQGGVDWDPIVIDNATNTLTVTFNDALSGAIELRAGSSSDPGCTSEGVLIYFNRDGGNPTITGPDCVVRGTSDDFSFTASPVGQYTWEVSPALPAGFTMPSNGNVLTIKPNGTITQAGTYTVTATLSGGCSASTPATFDFEIGPEQPTITGGSTCSAASTTNSFSITSSGASTYVATVTTASGGSVSSPALPIVVPFNYTQTAEDATISFTTFSSAGCESLPTVIEVRTQPSVTAITSSNLCVGLNETPTITFTATGLIGNIDDYEWTSPTGWSLNSGGNGFPFITLELDATTTGDVCVTPKNGTCIGDQVCFSVPRNALNVTFQTQTFPGTPFIAVTATSATPLILNWKRSTDCDSGPIFDNGMQQTQLNLTPRYSTTYFYLPDGIVSPWASLGAVLPADTTCNRCFTFNLDNEQPGANGRVAAKQRINTSIDLNVYPNPVENILNVKIPQEVKVSQTYLVDAKGNVVFQSTETSNTQKIDVSKFAKGMYYLAVVTDKGMQGKKIIIE